MSLDALAPDQRAVVQLVLQQDRSYDELAGLLGISADAVRDRARRGLDRLAPADEVGEDARGDIADYLLGQQSVSGRERTRSLLAGSAAARAWAHAVAAELRDVARTPLPEVPGAEPEAITDTARGGAGVAAPGRREGEEPVRRERPRRPSPEPQDTPAAAEPAVRARPRPRPRPDRGRPGAADRERAATSTAADRPADGPGNGDRAGTSGDAPRSSRLGGAILLAGLAIVLVAAVIWIINRNGEDDGVGTARNEATPTATATATPDGEFQALGRIPLRAPGGGDAQGEMIIFASRGDGGLAFTIQGTDVPPTQRGEAYAVWLTGGDENHRLGFAPQVGEDGRLGTSGPRQSDQQRFARWFTEARRVVVSREREEGTTAPGPIILQGRVPRGDSGG